MLLNTGAYKLSLHQSLNLSGLHSAMKLVDEGIKLPQMGKAESRLQTGDERIELPPKVLETPIIPFDQSPIYY